ncbi:MAG: DUF732 domain-containing protein [Rhodococcus sp. (in: high G+C Gram-positive bacteria)]|uniref:Uncharacterized protein DUF732 n=1 Tax=Rhodococcus rhodochrous J45 TaxID=935266 RepID=A0A562EM86_RHORH|nr:MULTISPECIES: DUF732 domain-containing protein [Rhodococcus]MXQ78786.1 DUF732 domain-containing protein [Rhodococcus rhodochrous]TWH23097.1 uncharacterized protein DUF732 [Rhodococcus rhodochrous J45]BDB58400.1 hypothetical protein RDE2_01940 [Rhodococcus sp. RDE2]
MPSRTRSRSTRVLGALAAALTATAVLSACGSDDSTATNTPTTSAATETSTSASTSAAETSTGAAGAESTDEAETSDASPAPSSPDAGEDTGAGTGAAPAPTPGAQAFLDGLRAEGVEPSDETGAVNIADYICSAQAQGGSPEEIKVFVTALVGSDAAAGGVELSEEQASSTADTYIAVAGETYCN